MPNRKIWGNLSAATLPIFMGQNVKDYADQIYHCVNDFDNLTALRQLLRYLIKTIDIHGILLMET